MVSSKKPAQRRTVNRKRKTKKTNKKGWAYGLSFAAGFLVCAGLLIFLWQLGGPTSSDNGVNPGVLEGLLVSARVDLKKQRQVLVQDDIERWKINLNQSERNSFLDGLSKTMTSMDLRLEIGEEVKRDGNLIRLVELNRQDGGVLRLILVVKDKVKPVNKTPVAAKKPKPKPVAKEVVSKPPPVKNPSEGPVIAIILDDIGQKQVTSLNPVLNLKYPVTFAVIPYLPYSVNCAKYLHNNDYEVILHMPMEPTNYPKSDPGEGAIFSHDPEDKIRASVNRAMQSIPFIKGVNNHMGSKVTANYRAMKPVIEEVSKQGLYFVDSRTNGSTVGYKLANELGVPSAERDVFLDSEISYEYTLKQIRETRAVADRQGFAIAIGHPYPTTLKALKDEMPNLAKAGYRFVYASSIVERVTGNL